MDSLPCSWGIWQLSRRIFCQSLHKCGNLLTQEVDVLCIHDEVHCPGRVNGWAAESSLDVKSREVYGYWCQS
jgi:hypothetical protein